MKLFRFFIPLLSMFILVSSCDIFGDDDDGFQPRLNIEDLPDNVKEYIEANYRDYDIEDAELEDYCDDVPVYEVELEDGPGPDVELYFSIDGAFLFAAFETSFSNLPDAVISAIETGFPDYQVSEDDDDDIERLELADGSLQYEVELELQSDSGSGLKVVFNEDGSIFCTGEDDDDDDGDDDNGDDDDLPQGARDYITANYAGYDIESVEKEDICDDQIVYEVELEDGPGPDVDLYFNLEWAFLFAATEISESDLPAAVLATIETDYPGYEIDDDIEQYELSDGSFQFKVELEPDNGDDVEIIFDENGGIVCRED